MLAPDALYLGPAHSEQTSWEPCAHPRPYLCPKGHPTPALLPLALLSFQNSAWPMGLSPERHSRLSWWPEPPCPFVKPGKNSTCPPGYGRAQWALLLKALICGSVVAPSPWQESPLGTPFQGLLLPTRHMAPLAGFTGPNLTCPCSLQWDSCWQHLQTAGEAGHGDRRGGGGPSPAAQALTLLHTHHLLGVFSHPVTTGTFCISFQGG